MTLELHRYFGYGVIKEVEVYSRKVDNFKLVDDFEEVDVSKEMQQHRKIGLRGLPAGIKHDNSRHFSDIWVPKSAFQV